MTWSTGFVWIIQGGRCGRGYIVHPLSVPYLIWTVLVRSADTDFVTCPMFHFIWQTDHRFVRVSLRLANRPSLVGYWKLNTSLLEIRDFRDWLESLIQWALVGAVTRNRWGGSVKHRIRDFAINYGHKLNLDKTKIAKSLEGKLSRAVEWGTLTIDLVRQDLERQVSERYKGYVVRSRLKRVPNEAVKSNTFVCEEVQSFPFRYIALLTHCKTLPPHPPHYLSLLTISLLSRPVIN